jgi:hypothetical protein
MSSTAQSIARELALGLLTQQWQPRQLSPSRINGADELLQACLGEAIALREAGQAQLSLELLQAAEQAGLNSPWLLDNQARALVELEQRQAAYELWSRLLEHSDRTAAELAQSMVELQETNLLNTLGSMCAHEGWVPRHLNDPQEGSLIERVLKEIITSRECDAAQLSLDLAQATLEQGWNHLWLLDNQARALVHLQREAEALAIWENLQNHGDSNLAAAATEMVQLYAARVTERDLERRCQQLIAQGDRQQAERLLLQALSKAPSAPGLRELLARLLRISDKDDLISQELGQREADLAVHERLLDALEEQLSGQRR